MDKTISIKVLGDRIMQHPLMQDLSFEQIVSYTVDFIRIVGAPKIFEDKTDLIPVKDYRAVLPCNLVNIIQVKENCHDYCMRASTDTFHTSNHESNPFEYTFRTQGDILYTNLKEGVLEVAYRSIAVDGEGYPLIPEDPVIIRALETYIKKQWFTILFDLGRIQPAVLQNVQQEYAFYVGQAQTKLIMPSLSEMESLTNMWVSLLHKTNEFKTGFKNTGAKELLKVQS